MYIQQFSRISHVLVSVANTLFDFFEAELLYLKY